MVEREENPLKLYTIVRKSLKLKGGKIGAQCQHALDYLFREALRISQLEKRHLKSEHVLDLGSFRLWQNSQAHTKIVLVASDEEFEEVKKAYPNDDLIKRHFLVIDAGFTQVEPNTETCLCVWPMHESSRAEILQSLKPL